MTKSLVNAAAESSLIGSVIRHGKDTFIDASSMIKEDDFSAHTNKIIWRCIEDLFSDPKCESIDVDSINVKAKSLNVDDTILSREAQEYLNLLQQRSFDQNNVRLFLYQVKKCSVLRSIRDKYSNTLEFIDNLEGDEDLSKVISHCEDNLISAMSSVFGDSDTTKLSSGLQDYVNNLIESEPVDQVGIPTGYPRYDHAIGGGVRDGTVNIIGARSKTGKSFDAMSRALNISKQGVPVYYLDTELTEEDQRARLVCMDADCPLTLFETGNFSRTEKYRSRVVESAKRVEEYPLYYDNISGLDHKEAMSMIRRWIVRHVGFREDGKAKDCVVIYDYFKLMSASSLTKSTPEYIQLGMMLTDLHNFAVQYSIPILGYVQLNRSGIENDSSDVIAGSDRILWLCSSFSILRDKDNQDDEIGCGFKHGNKKIKIIATRYGPGLPNPSDYINIFANMRPGVNDDQASGKMTEGKTYVEVCRENKDVDSVLSE